MKYLQVLESLAPTEMNGAQLTMLDLEYEKKFQTMIESSGDKILPFISSSQRIYTATLLKQTVCFRNCCFTTLKSESCTTATRLLLQRLRKELHQKRQKFPSNLIFKQKMY